MFMSLKRKKMMMFKSEGTKKSSKRLGCLLTFIFRVSAVVAVGGAIFYFLAILLWPMLYIVLTIVTLGLILLTETPIDPTGFLETLTPVLTVAFIICVVAFVLRFVIDWLLILAESRSLNKKPEENVHYINIARVVKRVKLIDIVVFAVMVISAVGIVVFTQGLTSAESLENLNKTLPVVLFVLFILTPIAGKIISHVLFSAVNSDITALLPKKTKKGGKNTSK